MAADDQAVQAQPSSITVFGLVPGEKMAEQRERLGQVLFGMSPGDDSGRVFGVSPASGWLFYSDPDILWANPAGRPAAADPEKIARAFIEQAERNVALDRTLQKIGFISLFPKLQLNAVRPVLHPQSLAVDHMVCQFDACVEAGGDVGQVLVDGARLDVRVGQDGKIGGLWSRWRPIANEQIAVRTPLADALDLSDGSIVYQFDDQTARQSFLAPYYAFRDDDDETLLPASNYSLLVMVLQQRAADGSTVLYAAVGGGSGQYGYAWVSWSPDGDAIVDRGTDQTAAVEAGTHTVALIVTDPTMGTSKQVEAAVFGVAAGIL